MSPVSIAIDARPFQSQPCGFTEYLSSVITCLRDANFHIRLIGNRPMSDRYPGLNGLDSLVFGSPRQFYWEQRDVPRYLQTSNHDIYFCGANRGIPFRKSVGVRYVLGLLDVIPYLFFREYFLGRWKTFLTDPSTVLETVSQLASVLRADAVTTISRQSADDIRRLFHRQNVTPLLIRLSAADHRPPLAPTRQFVYVGGADTRKRVDILVRAFGQFVERHADYRLVLIGANYDPVRPLIAELGLQDRVSVTGYVDHEEKFRMLRQSDAMIYPSLYEGYGLAIAEGFQANIAVAAGPGGSQAEVGGTGVRRIDPRSVDDVLAAMNEMLSPGRRAHWVARGQEQLAKLTDPAIETAIVRYFAEQGKQARAVRAGVMTRAAQKV